MPAPEDIRCVALLGHSHDGKTTLGEAILHAAGATQRMGAGEHAAAVLDHEPEEQRRSTSIVTSFAHCDWRGTRIDLVDAPGLPDFAGEQAEALAAVDGAVLVVGANGGVPVGAELAWEQVQALSLPALIVVTKMDKENAAYEATVDALRGAFGRRPIAVAVPIGSADGFVGYVDLIDDTAHRFTVRGGTEAGELPEDMRDEVERAHAALVEAAAETDDRLLERYLEGEQLGDQEIRSAIGTAALRGSLVPVVCAAAASERGTQLVLDSLVRYLPSPAARRREGRDAAGTSVEVIADPAGPLVAQVVKTSIDPFGKVSYLRVLRGTLVGDAHPWNARTGQEERFAQLGRPMGRALVPAPDVPAGDIAAVTKLTHAVTGDTLCARGAAVVMPRPDIPAAAYVAAVSVTGKGDEDKIMSALARQAEEDPTFSVSRDEVTKQVLVHGLSDMHLEVSLERIKRKYGVEASLGPPKIPYRETITTTARVQHRYKKQSGGAGMYGDCTIEIEPLPRGGGFEWEDKIFGGAIPQQFRPSVEKGVRQTMEQGALSGHPVVDVRVRLVDGSTHPVDGKDLAFQLAGSMAMRKAVLAARPVLLEPIMAVEVTVPERLMGDVIGLLNSRRGRVAGMNPLGDGRAEVSAQIPQSEMYDLPIALRAMTQGRGRYTATLSHYEEVPAHVAQPLIDSHARDHAAATA